MIRSHARQWVREALAPHLEEGYRIGDTLLDLTIESNREFLAENLRIEDVPLLEVREQFFFANHEFDANLQYIEFSLGEDTRVRDQVEIIDASENTSYRGLLVERQALVQDLSEEMSVFGIDNKRDVIPVFRGGDVCQIYKSLAPSGGWQVGVDYVIVNVIKKPTELADTELPRRLKEQHELYALKLAYADIMLTQIGNLQFKEARQAILQEIGLQK